MGLKITGLNELRERLERLRPEEVMARTLAEQAERMAARVQEGLSAPQGASGHDEPWLQTGALRDSVGAQVDGLQAAVGSSDPAAVPQELGTARVLPRPFLAPVAAGMGEKVARAVAAAVVAALRGDSPDAGSARVDLCGDGPDGSDPLYGGAIAGVGTPRTHDGGFMLASGKADGRDDPLRELRKDLGEETPEEEDEEIEHGKLNPLHVPGIAPGGGALPFGPGRLDAGSSPPAPRTASPQPSPPPARPAAPGAAPTGQPPAQAVPGSQGPIPAGSSRTLADLINELVSKGTKITPPDVVAATRMPDGNIAFLERGNSKSGLQHIIERHGAEFAQAGIPEGKIPDFLTQALKNGKLVGQQSRRGGRPIYEVSYEGRTLRVAITVGSNGYIVGANMQ